MNCNVYRQGSTAVKCPNEILGTIYTVPHKAQVVDILLHTKDVPRMN